MIEQLNEIKKSLKEKKALVGTSSALKYLKMGRLKKIWLSSNVPVSIKDDIIRYQKLSDVEIINLEIPNDELGVLCKKQYSVSIVSLIKGEN